MPTSQTAPIIDVLMPVYNAERTIEEATRSILAQSIRDVRVIAVDDGSTDATNAILRRLAEEDRRLLLITKPNSGIVDTLNLALEAATAPFVARHDADDVSFPDRFERQLDCLSRQSDVVAVSGSCIHIDGDGNETGTRYEPWDPALADFGCLPSLEPYLLHPFLLARTEAMRAVGGYRYVIHSEDTDLYWRLREIGRLVNLDEALGKMRLHAASVSNASVVNGRIMAVSSQLAAISARRRSRQITDLAFPPDMLGRYQSARHLEAIIDLAGQSLKPDERSYLRQAAAVKLLELATGRDYELEPQDCRFIKSVYSALPAARLRGKCVANWAYRATWMRFLATRQLDRIREFASPFTMGKALVLRML